MLLSSAEVLAHFDPTRRSSWHVCDALLYGIGAILSHKMPDGTDRPVGFASRTLSSAEKNYLQLEKEGLAFFIHEINMKVHSTLITFNHKFHALNSCTST